MFIKNVDYFKLALILLVLSVLIMFSISAITVIKNQRQSINVFLNATESLTRASSFSERREYIDSLNSFFENSRTFDTMALIYTLMSTAMIGAGLYILNLISEKSKKLHKKANSFETEITRLQKEVAITEARLIKQELFSLATDTAHVASFLEIYGNTGDSVALFRYNPRFLNSLQLFYECFERNRTKITSLTLEEKRNYDAVFSNVLLSYNHVASMHPQIYTQAFYIGFNNIYAKCLKCLSDVEII